MQPIINFNLKNMTKKLLAIAILFATLIVFTSCEKQCVCKTTRITNSTNDVMENEMGKMSEKECLEYNGTVIDGVGITRTIDCHLN